MITSIHRTFASDRGSTRWWAALASAAMIVAMASLPAVAADSDPPPPAEETVAVQMEEPAEAVAAEQLNEVAAEEAAPEAGPAPAEEAIPVEVTAPAPAEETGAEPAAEEAAEPVEAAPAAEPGTADAVEGSTPGDPGVTDEPVLPATSGPKAMARSIEDPVPADLAAELTTLDADASVTLEGCRLPSGAILDDPTICPDGYYTTGNLGKSWNELDLVPHRVTATGAGSFVGVIAADNEDESRPGYDYMSEPVLNSSLSTGICTLTSSDQRYEAPGIGGTDVTLYRDVTLENTGATRSTCVFDYYVRLALGSHLFPGSSLHSNLANPELGTGGVGARDVSIPVKEIEPQELDKEMGATQGRDYDWTLTKKAAPTTVDFPETCLVDEGSNEMPVTITVEWTRTAALPSGDILIETQVTATNPAHRIIDVTVVDKWYEGSTASGPVIHTENGTASVPAATEGERALVPGTYTWTFSNLIASTATTFNDVATATYTDKITGVAVPGTTTATGSATVGDSGVVTDATATLSDVESITGAGFAFSVDSVTPAGGSFGEYVAGTPTTGDVTWTTTLAPVGPDEASGSFTFDKTVYASEGSAGTGELSDKATLTPSDSEALTANAAVELSAAATGPEVRIRKTVDIAPMADATFAFTIYALGQEGRIEPGTAVTVVIPAGELTGVSEFVEMPASEFGYEYVETPANGYTADGDGVIPALENCAQYTEDVTNIRQLGDLVIQKALTGPVAGALTEFAVTVDCQPGTAYDYTGVLLNEANGWKATLKGIPTGLMCTVTETGIPAGWQQVSIAPNPVEIGRTPATVTVTNARTLGDLVIQKAVTGPVTGAVPDFTVAADCSVDAFDRADIALTQANGWRATLTGIPTGVQCAVTETGIPAGWTLVSITPTQPVIIGLVPGTVTITNSTPGVPTLDKSSVPGNSDVEIDDVITFTVIVGNVGGSAISGPVVDTLPAGLILVAGSITGGGVPSSDGRSITWQVTLAPGASLSFSFQADVDEDVTDGQVLVNVATFLGEQDSTTHTVDIPAVIEGVEDEEEVVAAEEIAATGADGVGRTTSVALVLMLAGGLMVVIGRRRSLLR